MDVQKYKWFETEKTQVQNGITALKPMMPNLDLKPNCSFNLYQKYNLNQPVYNFQVITNEIICNSRGRKGNLHDKICAFPTPPQKKKKDDVLA